MLLVPFRTVTPAQRDVHPEPRPGRLPRQTRPDAPRLADRPAAPVAPAVSGDALAIERAPDVDPNWAAAPSGSAATSRDLRSYALLVAGRVDAQARQGKPAPLDAADTPLRRLQGNMAQAAEGGATSTTIARSLSGEPITVIRRNGRARCYTPVSTSVAPSAVFDNRGSGRSTEVNCPKEVR